MSLDPTLDYNKTLEAVLESGYGRSTDAGALLGEHGLLTPLVGESELNLQQVADFLDKMGSVTDRVLYGGETVEDFITLTDGTRIETDTLTDDEIYKYLSLIHI